MYKILIVDDRPNFKEAVEDALGVRMGYQVDVDMRVPLKRSVPFGCEMPTPRELEQYDFALIDLELFPPTSSVEYQEGDLRGGTEVLPYLRKHAPWMPTLAVSRLFADRSDSFLALAGGFGFDAYLPQAVFGPRGILKDEWEGILKRAQKLRRSSLLNTSDATPATSQSIQIDPNLSNTLTANIPEWRRCIERLFYFADSIVLEEMTSGFSGAALLKAYVTVPKSDASFEGEWAAKLSLSPGKLHEETAAHLRLLRNGFPFTRMVPLLWPGVLVEERVGGIAYKFASGSHTAARELTLGTPLGQFAKRVAGLLSVLYKSASARKGIAGEVLRPALNLRRLTDGLSLMAGSARKDTLIALANSTADPTVSKAVNFRQGYVHGDLHCANIMFGPSDVLIDFPYAGPGPLVVDAGRLLVDLLLRRPDLRTKLAVSWSSLPAPLSPMLRVFDLTDDDRHLFELAFDSFAVEALTYTHLDSAARDWIKSAVSARA